MRERAGVAARELPGDLITLDELTARVGLSVRNVRFYTTRGLVPPPIRRGRSGYYSPDHVARLELVQELQGHGFTLAAIEQYVAGIPAEASPADIALRRTMLAPWHSDRPIRMSRTELESRTEHDLLAEDLETLVALGIISMREDGDYDVALAQLSVGFGILEVGFPLEAARAANEVYARHGRQIAHEIYDVFRTHAWPAYKESGATPESIQGVVERLKPLSIASVVAAYEQGMDDTVRENISHRAGEPPASP